MTSKKTKKSYKAIADEINVKIKSVRPLDTVVIGGVLLFALMAIAVLTSEHNDMQSKANIIKEDSDLEVLEYSFKGCKLNSSAGDMYVEDYDTPKFYVKENCGRMVIRNKKLDQNLTKIFYITNKALWNNTLTE
jgi:hypothetical protein